MSVIEEPVKTPVVDDCAVLRFAALGSHALPARRGGRRRIVAPDGSELAPATKPQPDGSLVKALARAHRWQRMLDEGRFASARELAEAERVGHSYLGRILRLTLLAPDVVEHILDGHRAPQLT